MCLLMALLEARHILHVSRVRAKCFLMTLLEARHILHVSRVRVKMSSDGIIRSSPYSLR